jgi:hypothetical protein
VLRPSYIQAFTSERRDFLKKAAYTAPAIFSLQATSAVAKAGSEKAASETSKPTPARKNKKGKKKQKNS